MGPAQYDDSMKILPFVMTVMLTSCSSVESITSAKPSGEAVEETECRDEARHKFNDIAAVQSGQTSYVPGAEEYFFETCMRRRKGR